MTAAPPGAGPPGTVAGSVPAGAAGLRPPDASLRAILFTLLAVLMFASMNGVVKYLLETHAVLQVVWGRYVFALIPVVAFAALRGVRPRDIARTRRPSLQLSRGLLLLGATLLFSSGLSFLPLAETEAISFVAPLFVTALSVPLLKEQVGWRRWAAVLVGFCGVLIIIRPGFGVFSWAAILPIGSALCYALYQIATRVAGRTDGPVQSLLYVSVVGAVVLSCVVPFVWVWPSPVAWLLLALVGVIGGLAHFLLIRALDLAPAAVLQPFTYAQLLGAVVVGYLLFGAFPDPWTVLGGLIVVGSGLYIIYREQARRRQARGTT